MASPPGSNRPRLGAVIFDDPSAPLRGWLCLEGHASVRIQDPGAIPTDVVCLSNLFQSDWTPRILDERFLGLGNAGRLLSEFGIPVQKRTQKGAFGRSKEIFEPVDPRSASEWLCRLFLAIWERLEDFREPLQKEANQGILL